MKNGGRDRFGTLEVNPQRSKRPKSSPRLLETPRVAEAVAHRMRADSLAGMVNASIQVALLCFRHGTLIRRRASPKSAQTKFLTLLAPFRHLLRGG